MEVHHHAHTAQKKWTHYLWEFMMLFLAVFCGFLAEYQLEHKIEKEKGKQYIRSFAEDLKADTSNFSSLIKEYEEKKTVLLTMYACHAALLKGDDNNISLKNLVNQSVYFPDLVYTDRTLLQLKNAGGLRLIPAADADSITGYDKLLRLYERHEETSFQEIQTSLRNTLFSAYNFKTLYDTTNVKVLFADNKESINRYFNQLYQYYTGTIANIEDLTVIRNKAVTLINYFNNKYHLK